MLGNKGKRCRVSMLKLKLQELGLQRRTLPVCWGPGKSNLLGLGLSSEGMTRVTTRAYSFVEL